MRKLEYKRLACFHVAAILQGVLDAGCLFEVIGGNDDFDDCSPESVVIAGISNAIEEIVSEFERRGKLSLTNAEAVEKERKRIESGKTRR